MVYMFSEANAFNADISRWDVSSVTSMRYMFLKPAGSTRTYRGGTSARSRTWLHVLSSQRVQRGHIAVGRQLGHETCRVCFMQAKSSTRTYRGGTSARSRTCRYVFSSQAFNADISRWDVSSVTNMQSMFYDASSTRTYRGGTSARSRTCRQCFINADISRWDVSSVTNMEQMFYHAYAFDADITRWDTSSVTHLFQMFYAATAWKSRFHNCGYHGSSSHQACGEVASYASSSGSDDGPPAAWVRKDDACDASTHPTTAAAATAPILYGPADRPFFFVGGHQRHHLI